MIELNKEESNFHDGEFFLHRLVYKGSTFLNQENEFWKLPFEEQMILFNPILEEFGHMKFSWIEEMEGHYLEAPEVEKRQPSTKFLEQIGVPITYKTGALGGKPYNKLNHKSILYWVGMNAWKNFEIPSERKFKKHFLYMNRMKKHWREDFFWKMYKNNLLDYSEWSWASHEEKDPLHKSIEGICINYEESHREMSLLPEYNSTFLSVVPETLFTNDGVSNNGTFITEKTEKCLAAGHPFVIVSTPYFLHNLKQLGFKTFDKWINEDYDTFEDPNDRMDCIIDTLHEISQWSTAKCEEVYKEMLPILKHNQKVNKEWRKNEQLCGEKMWIDLDDTYEFWIDNRKLI